MVRYSKYEVYDFLKAKKEATQEKATAPFEKELDEKIKLYMASKTKNVNKEKFFNLVKELNAELEKIEFDYATYSSKCYDVKNVTGNILEKVEKYGLDEFLREDVERATSLTDMPDYNQLRNNVRSIRNEISDEFKKLEALVKRSKSGAAAVEKLKELGFDTSSIKPVDPITTEVALLNINNDLLGLPEAGTELAEATTF